MNSGQRYEPVAKSQLKKVTKLWQQEVRKAEEKAKRDAEAEEATKKRAEEAKKIVIQEDTSLPPAIKIKIMAGATHRDQRVKVRSGGMTMTLLGIIYVPKLRPIICTSIKAIYSKVYVFYCATSRCLDGCTGSGDKAKR